LVLHYTIKWLKLLKKSKSRDCTITILKNYLRTNYFAQVIILYWLMKFYWKQIIWEKLSLIHETNNFVISFYLPLNSTAITPLGMLAQKIFKTIYLLIHIITYLYKHVICRHRYSNYFNFITLFMGISKSFYATNMMYSTNFNEYLFILVKKKYLYKHKIF
jgi:hypothetical protein